MTHAPIVKGSIPWRLLPATPASHARCFHQAGALRAQAACQRSRSRASKFILAPRRPIHIDVPRARKRRQTTSTPTPIAGRDRGAEAAAEICQRGQSSFGQDWHAALVIRKTRLQQLAEISAKAALHISGSIRTRTLHKEHYIHHSLTCWRPSLRLLQPPESYDVRRLRGKSL